MLNKKYKTMFFTSIILFIAITTVPTIFLFSSDDYDTEKSGKYFYSREEIRKNGKKEVAWDISIDNSIKKHIIENENNEAPLSEFRIKIIEMKKYKYEMFYQVAYLLLIIGTFIFMVKGIVTWKSDKEKKLSKFILSIFIILIFIKIIFISSDICTTSKDLRYYYKIIEK